MQSSLRQLMHALDGRSELVEELRPGNRFPVNVLSVPVFDAGGEPIINLSLHLMRDEMTYEEFDDLARRTLDVARFVTQAIGGRVP
jgi:DNA-binding IclR family transcriptional regulator